MTGFVVTDHTIQVPVDWADPARFGAITVFAREIVDPAHVGDDLPLLLFLQGGPGGMGPRPMPGAGWWATALRTHRVVLLDQRGTGRSSRVDGRVISRFDDARTAADYLACFRQDVIVADAEHQWLTDTRASRRSAQAAAAIRTTREIAETLRCPAADRRRNHWIANSAPLQGGHAEVSVPPYTLGAWLGDRATSDPEILMRIEGEGLTPRDKEMRLRALGVLGDKHIPAEYLRASEAQRRALLAGILDADGMVTDDGAVLVRVTQERLARDVAELVVSLGYRCHTEVAPAAYVIDFSATDPVFGIHRKELLHKERRASSSVRTSSRFIVDARRVESVPVRCVEVDNDSHMYLASRSMIPTHNSTLGLDFMRSCSIKHQLPSVIFSLEMSKSEIVMRLLSAEANIKLADMRSGRMSDDDWTRLARRMGEFS
jgi:replicative DNA helicase